MLQWFLIFVYSVSYYAGSTMKNYYDGRFGGSRFWTMKAWKRPEDETGLVGSAEQSIYWWKQ